jgi:hypothetical protein
MVEILPFHTETRFCMFSAFACLLFQDSDIIPLRRVFEALFSFSDFEVGCLRHIFILCDSPHTQIFVAKQLRQKDNKVVFFLVVLSEMAIAS